MIKETKNLKLTLEADFSVSDSRTKYFESLDIISPTLPRLQSSPFRPYRNTCLVACHTAVAPVVRRECDGNFLNIPSVFLSFFLSFFLSPSVTTSFCSLRVCSRSPLTHAVASRLPKTGIGALVFVLLSAKPEG